MQGIKTLREIGTYILICSLLLSAFGFRGGAPLVQAQTVSGVEQTVAVSAADEDAMEYSDYIEQASIGDYTGKNIVVSATAYSRQEEAQTQKTHFAGKQDVLLWTGNTGLVEWQVEVPVNGLYQINIDYCAVADSDQDLECAIIINGEIPFAEAETLLLSRVWKDKGEPFVDSMGNEVSTSQIQEECWQSWDFRDAEGLYVNPLRFYLRAGMNTVALQLKSGSLALEKLTFSGYTPVSTYKEYMQSVDSSAPVYSGKDIVLQGEDATYKSSRDLRALSDKSDPSVEPSNPKVGLLNYIGGTNWDGAGERLEWTQDISETGWYALSFKFRQDAVTNSSSYRRLTVDGQSLFEEAEAIAFSYGMNWQILTLSADGEAALIYLEKGPHTFGLEVTLGPVAEATCQLEELVFKIGEMYRKIIMITGTSPDINRDYRLYDQIPGLLEDLQTYYEELQQMADAYDGLSGVKGGSQASTLRELATVLNSMRNSKFRMHEYVSNLYSSYSSAAAWIYEMRVLPLDLDAIILSSPQANLKKEHLASFGEKFVFSVRSFLYSFIGDYSSMSTVDNADAPTLNLWTNWGREQVQILNTMVQEDFTPQTGIQVSIKITGASLIQGLLSGRAPDCSLMVSRDTPVNLALRGVLVELSQFKDFDQVMERFAPGAATGYEFQGGIYGLPDTQAFPIMFIRTDVFDELGLKIPTTWEELMQCSEVIMRNNMSVGIPNMYTSMLYQYGGRLYNADKTQTELMSAESVAAFNYVASLFRDYKFPVSFDFYNRFRTGEMPVGITGFTEYARLMEAAPEIRGRWQMYPVPGVPLEDGTINNTVADSGTAAIILNTCEDPYSAWEFLKWWTSDTAQLRYASDVESVLGIISRHSTANLEAFAKLSWGNGLTAIDEQRENLVVLPETPGGYYLTRALDNAFYSTIYEGENERDMLSYWSGMVDEEMKRKQQEYALFD